MLGYAQSSRTFRRYHSGIASLSIVIAQVFVLFDLLHPFTAPPPQLRARSSLVVGGRGLVFQDDVEGVDDAYSRTVSNHSMNEGLGSCLRLTRNVAQDGEQDVDEEVGAAAALEEDSDGREEDGEDNLDDVAGAGSVSIAIAKTVMR